MGLTRSFCINFSVNLLKSKDSFSSSISYKISYITSNSSGVIVLKSILAAVIIPSPSLSNPIYNFFNFSFTWG